MIFRAYCSVSTLFLRCFLLNTGRSLSLWGCTACEAVRVLVNASFPGVIRRRKEELDTQAPFCTRVCIFYHNYVSPHGSRCSCLLLVSRRWRSSSSAFAASRILRTFAAAEFSRNYFFQRLIITGDSSYFAPSSLSVSRSLMASMATFALNLASYYFLVCFMTQSY